MKRILYLLGVFLILSIIGCGKPMSKGADDELIILAAIEDADAARKILTKYSVIRCIPLLRSHTIKPKL